jgi:histidinol dehydrogenase
MKIAFVKTGDKSFSPTLERIIRRRGEGEKQALSRVEEIIRAVRDNGDRALLHYTRLFDKVRLDRGGLEIPKSRIRQAMKSVPKDDLRVMRLAAERIASFHRRQLEKSWSYRDSLGIVLGQKLTPLERIGVYVPGGKAAYPSTVLMNVIPAKVAGVREVVMTSPVGEDSAAVLAAAGIAGVDRVFRVGGAQAIAALAFGTQTVPKVDKIVGPGNVYVAAAKRLVFGEVDIDSIAGPSEILILADARANPAFVAADMLSQAEHDELAAAFCVTPSLSLARRVRAALETEVARTRRQEITLRALEKYGAIIVCRADGTPARAFGFGDSKRRRDFRGAVFDAAVGRLHGRPQSCFADGRKRAVLFSSGKLRFHQAHESDSGGQKGAQVVGPGNHSDGAAGRALRACASRGSTVSGER